jgi:hypothetical protein
MTISDEGQIFVVDGENQRVQVISPELPDPDQNSGLILNGDFSSTEVANTSSQSPGLAMSIPYAMTEVIREGVSGLDFWAYGGSLPIGRSAVMVNEGTYSLELGEQNTPAEPQGITEAWAYQAFYVRPEWVEPVLTFNYRVFTNDAKTKSNFIAEIQDGVGLNNLDIISLEGYEGNTPDEIPAAGTDLGWKSVEYDLSPYQGQYIRLAFSNRNLYPSSLGVWSYVEKVEVRDDALKMFVPLMLR